MNAVCTHLYLFFARKDLLVQTKSKRKVVYLPCILGLLVLVLAACGSGGGTSPTSGVTPASPYQVSSDGLTYTFTLKSGLKFNDGTPLTADDVAYSLNRVLLPATKSA